MPTRVLVPSGVLGLGFDDAALAEGIARRPDIICIDGGSTDSGPHSLGTGTSKYSRNACKSEWRQLLQARAAAGVPLVIGSSGTCGTDSTVDWMFDITRELVEEMDQTVRVARLYCSQPQGRIAEALAAGQLHPIDPAPEIDADRIASLSNVVALAGAEQIAAAIATGAEIIIAGRTTDTALIAALPLMRGGHAGAAWHGAKITECGALCTTQPTTGVVMLEVDETGFEVEPMASSAACTPETVFAHMLYENANPFQLSEPGGYLDVTHASYRAIDDRRVRAEGARWVPRPYTVKLEGARHVGFQTIMLALLREARYVRNARTWADRLRTVVLKKVDSQIGIDAASINLEIRLIGIDATLGALEPDSGQQIEIGVLIVITADTQDLAEEVARLINPFLLHLPLTENEALPTFAFPFSPVHSNRGAVFEFALNHELRLEDPMEAFRLEVTEVGHGVAG